jgi:hypothetical protein
VKTLVLTAQPLDLDITAREDLAVRPLPKAADPAQVVRDGFIRGAEVVALADVPLDTDELQRGLDALVESDAAAWLDPRPLGPSKTVLRLREQLVPPHVAAVAVRKHAWDAIGNHARSGRVRSVVVEVAVRVARAGLDVRYLDAAASPGWSLREGTDVVWGWLVGHRADRVSSR